jgi:hypothetical protein
MLRIASGNAPSLTTIQLGSSGQRNSSVAVFNVTATVENFNVNSSSVPLNISIPANPNSSITSSGGASVTITQQTDMTSIAALYDEFRLDGVSVHYQPAYMGNNANFARGGIIADYDSVPGLTFSTLKTLMEYENSLFMNFNAESEFLFVPNRVQKNSTPWQSTQSTNSLGGISIGLWASTSVTIGSVVVKWRIIARGASF